MSDWLDEIGEWIGDVFFFWKGKRLAILGERNVGKTTLHHFLTTGTIPETHKATVASENVKRGRFQLRDLDLRIKKSKDLPGGADSYPHWEELFKEADVVFYLFRVDGLMNRIAETECRVGRDMGQINRWLEERRPDAPLFIIGTFCDLANPDWASLSGTERVTYEEDIRALETIKKCVLLAGGGGKAKVVVGSLKSPRDAEELLYKIFHQIEVED